VFRPLGSDELGRILDIELNMVQQRIFNTSGEKAFIFTLTEGSKQFLLREGTDMKYGARHLKRAIERLVVQPMSNLIATEQVRGGDWVRVEFDEKANQLVFLKESEGLPIQDMAKLVDTSITLPQAALANAAVFEAAKSQSARSSKRS
jgi:ATP-dependent Clp protease ATP-binding subunit ClpA